MLKNLLIAAVVVGACVFAAGKMHVSSYFMPTPTAGGVKIGATVAEVEKVWGPPVAESPSFGREERIYKLPNGHKYMLIFEDGKVVEIH